MTWFHYAIVLLALVHLGLAVADWLKNDKIEALFDLAWATMSASLLVIA